jgi:hypothetical protein
MGTIKDSFGQEISRGYMAFSFIGMSESGCTQHLAKAKIAYNGVLYTLKTKLEWRFGSFSKGTPVEKVLIAVSGPKFCKMITEKQYDKFPTNITVIIFSKDDFKAICEKEAK